jgi:hypothetical protein
MGTHRAELSAGITWSTDGFGAPMPLSRDFLRGSAFLTRKKNRVMSHFWHVHEKGPIPSGHGARTGS